MRLARFLIVALLCLAVAAYAVVAYGFLPLGALVAPAMRANFNVHWLGIYAHVFGSVAAIALGPLQFSRRLRTHHVHLHRWLGRIYLGVGVGIGGLAGLFMAFHAQGGPAARMGFGVLALAWLYSGFSAYRAIRGGDVASHRRWMIRNFALTLAAVTLRIYLPAALACGIPFETAYAAIAWLAWVPNLALAELLLRGCYHHATPSLPNSYVR
jgi:uncharacterized membrane protein